MKKEAYDCLYRKDHPQRIKAKNILNNAVAAGKIKRPDKCSLCPKIGNIEAHHEDYSKPLVVLWVCKRCHKKLFYLQLKRKKKR